MKKRTRECKNCGKTFETIVANKVFCSKICKLKTHEKTFPDYCLWCHNPTPIKYGARNTKAKFCNYPQCRIDYYTMRDRIIELDVSEETTKLLLEKLFKEGYGFKLPEIKQVRSHGLEHDTSKSGFANDSQSSSPDPERC